MPIITRQVYQQPPADNAYNPNGNYGQAAPASTQAANNYNAYQPQPQPNAYGQAATPAKTKAGGLPLPALIGVAVVVALLIIAGLVLVVSGGGGGGDIVAPPNSTKVNLTLDDFKKLSPDKVSGDTSGVTLVSYDSTDSPDSLTKFYKDDLTKKGWTTKEDTASSLTFTKGDQTSAVAMVPLPDPATITALETVLPGLKGQLKAGDTLVITIKGPTSKLNTTPTAVLIGMAA